MSSKKGKNDIALNIKQISQNLLFILNLDFLTLLVADKLNPSINFINNNITKPMIVVYSALLVINSLFSLDITLDKTEYKAAGSIGMFLSVVELLFGAVCLSIAILKRSTLLRSKQFFILAAVITLIHTVFMIVWISKIKAKESGTEGNQEENPKEKLTEKKES